MKKKKILTLSWHSGKTSVQTAGGNKRAYEIVKRCPENINMVCLDSKPSYFTLIDNPNVSVFEYKIPKIIEILININFELGKIFEKMFTSLKLIYLISRKYKEYVIYVPYSELPQLTLAGSFAYIFLGNRVVFCNLNVNHYFPENIFNPILHKFSNLNITISKNLKNSLVKKGIKCDITNPVGIDLDYPKKVSEQEKNIDGIFIGRHTPEKGILDVLDICAEINKKQDFNLVTIGNIPDNMINIIKSKIKKLKLEDRVKINGIVSEEDKYINLKKSRVCLFPSHQEGWGIVPQEAIACGVPVVAYDLAIFKENILGCPALRVVKENNIKDFADNVLFFLKLDSKSLNHKIQKSLQIISKFSWDIISTNEYKYILGDFSR